MLSHQTVAVNMMFLDTHAHINLKAFEGDFAEILQKCLDGGVGVINVGTDMATSRRAVELVEDNLSPALSSEGEGVWAVVGLHPSHTYDNPYLDENESGIAIGREVFDYEAYKLLAQHPRVVGIGECGLDYYRLPSDDQPSGSPVIPVSSSDISDPSLVIQVSTKESLWTTAGRPESKSLNHGSRTAFAKPHLSGMTEKDEHAVTSQTELIKTQQKQAFELQIKLALELNKALVIHCRPSNGKTDAYDDVLSILKTETRNSKLETPRFEVHSFTGDWPTAEKFLELGGYLGINGILTFDKTGVLAEVVKNTPLERILLETDSPYLAPAPNRGKRNEPWAVKIVAQKIAELKNLSIEDVAEQTTKNAKELFDIVR